ncbi:centromere protein F-like [Hemicordylus capensis]|uniref:centromere protein F-like n=1 Tax=Hemicordylus capensis TaxID=884348 RepID=UPI00230387AF|nr:centromere protein F-like [Hemicordylus capensis]XP_053167106.1 centromere protein F-like [Hemicordylus capensis]
MALEELSLINDNLRGQIHDLRETLACLDTENQELLTANRRIKDQNRSLQDIADEFKATMEEMQKKVEDIRERMDGANAKIHHLEVQNKLLVKSNEELNKELHEVSCQMALFEDYKAAQEKDLLEMQNLSTEVKKYLKTLEERLEETEQHFHVEKCHSSQLRERVGALLQLRETQRKDIRDLQGQLEMSVQRATFLRLDQENRVQVGSLMHEIVEAKLVDVALNRSKKRKVMHWMWNVAKLMAILVFFCALLLGLALLYTYFINQEFISESIVMFFSDENIEKMERILSHYLNWRNDGLLPF